MAVDSLLLAAYIIWFSVIYVNGGVDTVNKRTSDVSVPFVSAELWWLWALLYVCVNLIILYQLFVVSERIAVAFFLGGCSTVPILVTPNTGWSISAIYIFMIILCSVMLFQNVDLSTSVKTIKTIICIFVGFIGICLFVPRLYRINSINVEREKNIKSDVFERIQKNKMAF